MAVSRVYLSSAFRTSLYASLVLFLITTLWGSATHGFSETLPHTAALSLINFFAVFFICRLLYRKRLLKIAEELDHLVNKRFFEREHVVNTGPIDEIDDIMNQINVTADTIEHEIQRLKRMENYRKEFIGDVSHELKTPIFAVQGFLETLQNGALEDPEVNHLFLQKAMRNVNRLILLTNDLMEISKLETGELKTTLQDVPLKPILLEIIESLQYKATAEQISLELLPFDPNLTVLADRNQIRQVLINLTENGIKYNKPGGTVKIGIRKNAQNPKKVTVFIQDSGIGIDAKHLNRVTERFYRIDKSRARDKGGTGLGLAIVKHIIEAHNEQLFIESTPNTGTTFSFTLQNANMISG